MTLHILSSDYFYGWENPALPAKYWISSSDIRLSDQDNGFMNFPELAQGKFALVYHGSWLTLIRQEGVNLPHIKVSRC